MPVDGRQLRAKAAKGAVVVAARQRFAFDYLALDGRIQGRAAVQREVVRDARFFHCGGFVPDGETDGRARRVEAVFDEGRDDDLVTTINVCDTSK